MSPIARFILLLNILSGDTQINIVFLFLCELLNNHSLRETHIIKVNHYLKAELVKIFSKNKNETNFRRIRYACRIFRYA